ncbi:MAG: PepSY-associated TM helix domain-containing protein [Gemmatimonadaceae bacterium]
MTKSPAFRAFLFTHRWLALVVSLPLIAVAVTGGAIVFEGAIDRALNPSLNYVSSTGPAVSLDTLAAHASAATNGGPVLAISPSLSDDRAATAVAGKGLSVYLDPHTGAVLGTRSSADREKSLARRLHVIHVHLFGNAIGGTIVGISTIVALAIVLTGLFVWWRDKLWRINTHASWKRIAFDIHHATGIITSLVLIVITASGLVIHYETLSDAIDKLNRSPPPPAQPKQPAADSSAVTISYDRAAQSAMTALPGAAVISVSIQPSPKAPVTVGMRFPEDHTPGGRSRVILNRFSGAPLSVVNTRTAELGTRINNVRRSLHTGDVYGKTTEGIWLAAVVAMVAQIVTGVLMWWNGRPARRANATRSRERDPSLARSA